MSKSTPYNVRELLPKAVANASELRCVALEEQVITSWRPKGRHSLTIAKKSGYGSYK